MENKNKNKNNNNSSNSLVFGRWPQTTTTQVIPWSLADGRRQKAICSTFPGAIHNIDCGRPTVRYDSRADQFGLPFYHFKNTYNSNGEHRTSVLLTVPG